ncbi:SDR family oxidoreductase [uncultured Sphingomonas sp.]|uniref:SDR family oxidoreductase n=1 Tax=uncultured Sphingomonas sp. TaxID=158754 RepID=UPI0035CAFC2B
MSKSPASRRVVITGASSGIGAATAAAFAVSGAHLVLAARGADGLEAVAARCRAAGGEAWVFPADVTDAAQSLALAHEAEARLGGIDLWFSDVGIGAVGKYQDVPIAAHARVIEANLLGHMNDAHAALPVFLRQGHGIFVNMISVGGFVATPFAAAYAASKFGLRGFSQALRGELSLHPRIHVCDVYPTFVDTPGLDHAGNYAGRRLTTPPGTLAPETVARAVVRLADRPRNTTVVGAPAPLFVLAQAFAPNLSAAIINSFFGTYFASAERVQPTAGALFAPGEPAGEAAGGLRRPDQRVKAAVAGGLGAAAVAALGLAWWATRRPRA